MAINDVSLTAGMRSNLLALQDTVNLLNRTQSRLSTGKKVNSAIDNPVSFFASQALTSRASVIDSLKDAMGQAVQTITAADKGIKAITAMIEQAKGIAQSALSAADVGELTSLQTQYNTLRTQLSELADDSGYKGKNLLANNDLIVKFEGTTLTVEGFDARAEGLGISSASNVAVTPLPEETWTSIIADSGPPILIQSPADWTQEDMDDFMAHPENYRFFTATGVIVGTGVVVAGSISTGQSVTWERYANGVNQTTGEPNSVTGTSWLDPGAIENSLAELDNALVTLRQESSKMSGNLSIITVRQEFSTNMINTLTEGADKLTLADTNEEGANMLMLQTRQSLSTTALSLSAQAAQAVLRLFQ